MHLFYTLLVLHAKGINDINEESLKKIVECIQKLKEDSK